MATVKMATEPLAVRSPLTGMFHPEGFGAVTYGKGVTSAQAQANAAAVQAAIDAANNGGGIAANTVGGGTVLIRDVIEVYKSGSVSALTLYSGVHLRGIGPGGNVFSGTDANLPFRGSVLRLWGGANQDLIRTANFAALTGVASPSAYATPNRFGIYDMVLDGNKAVNTSGDVLKIYGQSYWLQNLVIQNGAGMGLYTEFGSSAGYDNEAQLHNLRITDNVGDGWQFFGPHDSVITNVFSSRNGGSGFVVGPNSGSLLVTNMHNWGNQGYNFDIGGQDCSFVNCVCDSAGGPGKAGIRLTQPYVRWIGGSIYGTNAQGEVAVQVGDGSTAVTITGMDFIGTRWFNFIPGSALIQYKANVTLGVNRWGGFVSIGTATRFFTGTGKAKVVGAQTTPITTLTVDSTTGFTSSGQLVTPAGTLTYTGITSTTFTGVTGGTGSVTLNDGGYVMQTLASPSGSENYEFRTADTNASLPIQAGAMSTTKQAVNYQSDFIGAVNIRAQMTQKQTLASSGAVAMDAGQGNGQRVLLQANATSSTIANATDTQELVVTWIQDATGGRTYAWPTNCKFAGGLAPSDTTANMRTTVRFKYDSATSNWYETARAVAVG